MLKISKLVAAVVGLSMALTLVAGVGSVSAQAMSLGDLVNLFISLGIISPDKAAAAKAAVSNTSSSVSFTRDLTIGSSGADVSALQSTLGVSPASGYFGSLTKAAVVKYQSANGLPSTGFVGALTRAKLNAGSSMTSTTPSTTVTTPSTTWTNTGVEGSITVSKASVSNTTAYEGDTMKPVVAFKVEAKLSNINVQRVKLNLGSASSVYTKIYKTIYVVNDAGAVLAQADLNANTVVKENSEYYLTLGGFSYVVAKDSSKVLTVKADLYSNIDSADIAVSRTVSVVANGVRGVDGAGIDQYGPSSSFSQTISLSANLADSATLKVSTNSANFKSTDVVAADGAANDQMDGVALLALDIRAEKDNVTINSLKVDIADTTDLSTTTTAYLYDGSTLVGSESVTGINATTGYVLFGGTSGDLNYVVSKDATKTLVVKVDVRSAATGANTLSASVTGSTTKIDAENSAGDTPTISGSATGESMVIRKVGPVFTLVGSPTIVRNSVSSNDTSGVATSTGSATFHIGVKAVGGDIAFGDAGSTTPAFATTSTTFASIYRNGSSVGAPSAITAGGTNATVSYSAPSSGVVVSGNTFTLQQNNSTTLDVTFSMSITGNAANNYAFQLNGIRWSNALTGQTSSTFMTDKADWRTGTVSLP